VQARFCKISEALEDNAITKFLCVPDQQVAISSPGLEIRAEAIRYVVHPTAELRRCNHINERTLGVRYGHFDGTAPERFQSEETFRFHEVQHENCTLSDHAFFSKTPGSEDQGFIEKLLCKFPMMRGCPAADVGLIEERWNENPRIGDHLFAACQVQRHRNIKTMSYSAEPALLLPSGKELRCSTPLDTECPRRDINRHDFLCGSEYCTEARTVGRQRIYPELHGYIIQHKVHVLWELRVAMYSWSLPAFCLARQLLGRAAHCRNDFLGEYIEYRNSPRGSYSSGLGYVRRRST
jgi:hypothetical protein